MIMLLHFLIAAAIGYISYKVLDNYRKKVWLRNAIRRRKVEQATNFEWARNNFEKLDEKRAAEIVDLTFFELKESLQNGLITPTEALRAYQRKAYEVQKSTNCICLFITESMDIATKLEHQASQDKNFEKPPFFGIPVSIKESIHVKNLDSTQGLSQNLFKPSDHHSTSVQQLIRQGAIPFVHTNIPQALLSFGCCNPIYGSTSNPLDLTRVPGGSSGGESALIASGGSPLGIGTDVGGSIRTPATFCGISGFKSSSERSPQMGKVASIPGRQLLQSVEGPLAPTIDVCVEYLKMKWNDPEIFTSDVYMPPVKFQNHLFESDKKLRIGYYTFDGYQVAPPANQRAVIDTVNLLRSEGHTLVEFEVPEPDNMFNIFCAGATTDGAIYLNRTLGNDIVPPECYIGFPVTKLPYFFQKLLRKYLPDKMRRMRGVLRAIPHNCEEMREMHEKIEDYRHGFVLAMKKLNLDAIVCPSFGSYPPRHGTPNKMISASSYTALYNLLDFAAGTVPISHISAKDEADVQDMKLGDAWDKLIKDESVNCKGLPISVQIATPPYREETCLRLLKLVEEKIGLKRANEFLLV